MYRNRRRRTSSNGQPQFYIRRSEIAFDERAAYIESVCAALLESRFGPGHISPVTIDNCGRPELEPSVFLDISDEEMVSCYVLSLQGRAGFQVTAYRQQMRPIPAGVNSAAALSPNQGRGSP